MKIILFKTNTKKNIDVKNDILEKDIYPVIDAKQPALVVKEIDGYKEVEPKYDSQTDNLIYAMNLYDGFIKFVNDLIELHADNDFDVAFVYNIWTDFYLKELELNDPRVIDFLKENIDRIENRLHAINDDVYVIRIEDAESYDNSPLTRDILNHESAYILGDGKKQDLKTILGEIKEDVLSRI